MFSKVHLLVPSYFINASLKPLANSYDPFKGAFNKCLYLKNKIKILFILKLSMCDFVCEFRHASVEIRRKPHVLVSIIYPV